MKRRSLHYQTFSLLLLTLASLVSLSVAWPKKLQAAGPISGTVFRDFNSNGVRDATEPGIEGVTATVYDADGNFQGSASSQSDGSYSINAGGDGPYRLEFSGWPSYLQPSAYGSHNATSVQFVSEGTTTADFALLNPADYSQPNPLVAISQLHNGQGTSAGTGNSTKPGVVAFNYNASGSAAPIISAYLPEVGAVWGNAYQRESQFLFTSSFLRRHAGFADGPGYIYLLDYSGGPSGTPVVKLNLQGITPANGGVAIDLGSVCRNSTTGGPGNPNCVSVVNGGTGLASDYQLPIEASQPSIDLDAFGKVGRISFGGIDLSEDESTLWLVNLNQRALISVDVSAVDNSDNTAFANSIGDVNQYLLSDLSGVPSCTDGVFRPWAISFRDGMGYLGGVCSGENETTMVNNPPNSITSTSVNRRDNSDLEAYVLQFDPNDIMAGFSTAVQFPLNYNREGHSGGALGDTTSIWQPWALQWSDFVDLTTGPSTYSSYAQPILANIEFADDGAMILGFADRFAFQLGLANYAAISGAMGAGYYSASAGDIIKVCSTGSGWVVEGMAPSCPVNEPADPNLLPDDGPSNGGEFFYNDYYNGGGANHRETAQGGLAYLPGSGEIMSVVMDPIGAGQGGVRTFDTSNGATVRSYRVYGGSFYDRLTFYKSNGLGDIELLRNPAPIEIGNLVWLDVNGNGRQDPGEPPIAGVTVTLHDASGTQIASAVTDANGNYLFSSATGTSTASFIYGLTDLTPTTDFSVRIDTSQPVLNGYVPSVVDFNGSAGDHHDSDGNPALNPGFVTAPLTTGAAGHNNHTYDFGFVPFSLGNRVWFDTDNDGQIDGTELGVDGVSVSLFLDANGDGVPDSATPLATTTTADGGYYRFDLLPANTYVVRINPLNFAPGGPLAGYNSSTPTEADPDTDVDNDDNGIDSATPATNGILSGPVTLGPTANEPTGELDLSPSGQGVADEQANMTVDFGFYRLTVGNQLWVDANNNGVLDGGESGTALAGVRVELYNGATLVAVTTTDANGAYLFDGQTDSNGVPNGLGLAPSTNYTVHIPASEFAPGEPLAPFHSSTGATSGIDSQDNGVDEPDLAANGISSAVFSLQPGSPTGGASVDNVTATTHNPTLDFGFYTLSLGNLVWYDTNNNGVLDGAESGISNVTVNLYRDSNNDGIPDGAAIATTVTNGTGHYLFTGLSADTYIVEIVPPAGHISSTGTTGSATGSYEPAPDPDNDVDSDDNGTTSGAVIRSAPVTLTAGGEPTGEPAIPTLTDPAPDASSNLTVDFGLFRPLRLGNLVWNDVNNNGLVDGGETGIGGVTVELLDSTNTVIATTTTDANGNYLFDNLIPGDYIVRIPASNFAAGGPLEDWVSSTGTNGSATGLYEAAPDPDNDVDNDDNGSFNSGAVVSAPITLSLNGEPDTAVDGDDTYGNMTVDFGFFEPASLGDYVWYDTTLNGVQDAGESGVPGVTVTLHNAADDSVVATTTTDANGAYLFDNLIPGTYYVVFSNLPAGYALVSNDLGGDDALDSDPDPFSGRTGNYTLVPGQHEPTVDAGITPSNQLRLGNLIWADYNDNGVVDPGEPGIPGVTVELLDATNNTVLATTTTDANGNYLFSNLDTGSYIVRIPASAFGAGAVLENWSSSSGGGTYEPAPDPDNDTDNDDNGSTQGTGEVLSDPITLTPLGEPDVGVDGDDTNGNLTVDFGFVPQLASLGDTVWYDSIRNNVQDPGEAGVPGVTVRLLDSTGTVIDTTTTDGNGNYLFTDLIPGVYSVEFDISTLPPDYRFVSQDVGGDDTTDSDADPTTGRTIQTTLTAGENDLTWDAGIYQLSSIGDTVWYDADGDGLQDAGEPGVPGVTVHLLDGSGTVIDTTTTDVNGNYLFENLEPGDYAIEVVPPAGYAFTTQDAGGDDTIDSDVDTTTGRTIVTTLDPGENDPTWDAGLVGIMSLGDLVWNDVNNNGVVDAGESGISGVTVRLLDNSGNVIATTTTDGSGNYLFDKLLPGDYMVEIDPPAGYVTSTGTNGSATGPYEAAPDPDNDVNNDDNGTLNGSVIRSSVVTLSPNSEPTNDGDSNPNSNLTIDFGLFQPASLGDYVWHDENENGLQDPGESGVPGVTVTLYDGSGNVVATTTTDNTGKYLFEGLIPGTYSVGFSNLPPELDQFTKRDQGSDDGLDSDADPTTGRTQPVTLGPGEHNPTLDAGIYERSPSAIALTSFEAKWQADKLVVSWVTGSERDTWGFYVLRSSDGSRANATHVHSAPVLGQGRGGLGASYQIVDESAQAGVVYTYWLEEIELDGSRHIYGPFKLEGAQPAGNYTVLLPFVSR